MAVKFYKYFCKPFFDYLFALIGIIVFAPVLVIVILLFIIKGQTPFFVQLRAGKNGRIFKVVKFRTMNNRKDAAGNLLPDAQRLTGFGRFLRKTSLDELPQLLNVLTGDMSIVGPRPLLVQYLPLYNERQKMRHLVKPGITGWAQINGRNSISWDAKFEFDVWYVNNISFWLDIRILVETFINIFKSKGINHPGNATMPNFVGNQPKN